MKKILTTLVLLMLCQNTFAANWFELEPNQYIDVDKSSYGYTSRGATFWMKFLNDGGIGNIENQKVSYVLTQVEIDCPYKKYRIRTIKAYGTNGQHLGTFDEPGAWQNIYPNSIFDVVREKLCK